MTDHDGVPPPDFPDASGPVPPAPAPLPDDPEADALAERLTGPMVLAMRKAAKLSRAEFSDLCAFPGATPSRVTTIETKEKWRGDDRPRVARVLMWLVREKGIEVPPPPGPAITITGTLATNTTYVAGYEPPSNGDAPVSDLVIPEGIEDTWSEEIAVLFVEPQPPGGSTGPHLRFEPSTDREGSPALDPIPPNGIRVSNGMMKAWNRCRRQWWLSWYRGLAPKYEDPYGIRANGIRIHRALAAFYVPEGQTPTDPREALARIHTETWTEIVNQARENTRGENFEVVQSELWSKFNDAISLERAMIDGYVEWLQETGADQDLQIIASETPRSVIAGTINNGATPVQLVALMDARAIRKSDGQRLFIDHKNTGDFTRLRRSLKQDPQMLTYHLVEWLSSPEGEAKCDGALYNMLRRVKRTGNAKPPFYDREHQPHSEIELSNWQEEVLGVAQQIYNASAALDQGESHYRIVPTTRTKDCYWECDFFTVCSMISDGSRADDHLEAFFEPADLWARYDNLDPSMTAEPVAP